jgi:UDP-GlcNAc:undecaprenyl-phosphate GlcNAc-1-phosphate transferase
MVSMGGAILGFLLYNWYPAKIYLGDGGAYSFGYMLAVSGLLAPVQKASTSIALLVPVLAVGLPIFDTLLTMARRFISKQKIFSPDRGHLHHVLLDAGISHRRVVIGLYAISCVFGSLSLVITLKRNRDIGYFLVAASVVGSVFWGISVKEQLRLAMKRSISGESKSARGSSVTENK